jgi:hypothetical protein
MEQYIRPPQAPESYGTFWHPVATDAPSPEGRSEGSAPRPNPVKDAYLEFVNVTEDVPAAARVERA